MSTLAIAILVGAGTWALLWALALWSLWARVDALEKRRPPTLDEPDRWEDPATGLTYEWTDGAWRGAGPPKTVCEACNSMGNTEGIPIPMGPWIDCPKCGGSR